MIIFSSLKHINMCRTKDEAKRGSRGKCKMENVAIGVQL